MTSPSPWMGAQPTWQQYLDFWSKGQEAGERNYQDTLTETRADRAMRLQVANGQLRNQRDQIAVTRGTQEADRWYKEQQVRLAESEHALDRERFGLQQELGRGELALKGELGRGELGLGLLNLKSSLRGASDWAAYLDLGENQTALQPASGFLQAIAAGQRVPGTDMSFGAAPTPISLAGLAGNTQQAQKDRLAADMSLAQSIAGNIGKVAPGTFESLSPDRLDYLKGLAETGGHSWRTLASAYDRAGIGQRSPFEY